MLTNSGGVLHTDYRALFRNVPGPVTVVTGVENGVAHATTVSSFSSLSLTPAYALVVLDLTSRMLGVIERTGRLGINLLADDQSDVGRQCSSKADDKMDTVDWTFTDELPQITDSAGWLACEAAQIIEVGDHKIVVAQPYRIQPSDRSPLLYHRAAFHLVGKTPTP
ncbi:flavin reductase family protein [Rhodococcus sp. Eu-32]|uniref:flavin reductase family protein n=1 Tax=Rhodococcus sp. Eu-32 TaxID=1017319 RepID=UPI000DF25D1E|nr:flavin reductase family protein [Rhodococcus sp. Eu-32]